MQIYCDVSTKNEKKSVCKLKKKDEKKMYSIHLGFGKLKKGWKGWSARLKQNIPK